MSGHLNQLSTPGGGVNRSTLEQRRVQLLDRVLSYTLKRSAKRCTIGLKVCGDGLTVTLPEWVSARQADAVVRKKAGWVMDRLERCAARAQPVLEGLDGESLGWLGRELRLTVTRHDKARTRITRTGMVLEVSVDARLEDTDCARVVVNAVRRWRKRAALELMTPKLEHYAARLGARQPKVSVREQKSRWGSCSADGSIRMNARLIAFDEPLIDYVCAHEACHLMVMDHSARFYALLDGLIVDRKARSRALRNAIPVGAFY